MFNKHETYNKVVTIIAEILNISPDDIKPTSSFEQLGADSLDRLEIVMKLEEVFGIDISDDQEATIKSVQDAADTLHAMRTK